MKTCTKCGIEKELTEFSKDKGKKYGLKLQCRTCISICSKKWRESNLEKAKENCRKSAKRWVENNQEKHREHSRRYYLKKKLEKA